MRALQQPAARPAAASQATAQHARRSRTRLAPVRAAPAAAETQGALEQLQVWAVANGVQGIGQEGSLLGLYQAGDGDRGVLALAAIPAGAQLLRVPLRLAITDQLDSDHHHHQQQQQQQQRWQDRLVANLLAQLALGPASPWAPYLAALPRHVPCALLSWSEAEVQQLQLPGAIAHIRQHRASHAWASCVPDAAGSPEQQLAWAHSVVMSRTFGNASQHGGVGVRMLVPLIDMLNHAGDQAPGGLLASEQPPVPGDNVRWDVVGPANSPNGCWEMLLSATQAIAEGSPLLLSYREGDSDDLLLHYGFVPPANPHDSLALFPSLADALEALWAADIGQGGNPAELAPRYAAALDAGLAALQAEAAEAAAGSDDWGAVLEALEPVKVASAGRVNGPLLAALQVLRGASAPAVSAAVAGLAWRALAGLPTSLACDLAWLVRVSQQAGDSEQEQLAAGLLRHYVRAWVPRYEPELQQRLTAALAASGSSGVAAPGGLPQARGKRAVPGPPAAAGGQQAQHLQQALGSDASSQPLAQLVDACVTGAAQPTGCRAPALRQALQFRAAKKQLLADLILAAGVPLQQLQQEQQAALAAGGVTGNAAPGLPWAEAVPAAAPAAV